MSPDSSQRRRAAGLLALSVVASLAFAVLAIVAAWPTDPLIRDEPVRVEAGRFAAGSTTFDVMSPLTCHGSVWLALDGQPQPRAARWHASRSPAARNDASKEE